FGGAAGAAKLVGYSNRDAAAIGTLMNTRGLTELIVLSIARQHHLIGPTLFAILIVMALVTTFATTPALRLIDPRGTMSEPPEAELAPAEEPALEPILVAVRDLRNVAALLGVAAPLGRKGHELVLAHAVTPSPVPTRVGAEESELAAERAALEATRRQLVADGIAARVVAFLTRDPGKDIVRLSRSIGADLVLLDGRRPLLAAGPPRGVVGRVLRDAPCDV